jgi:hypothetical protein
VTWMLTWLTSRSLQAGTELRLRRMHVQTSIAMETLTWLTSHCSHSTTSTDAKLVQALY